MSVNPRPAPLDSAKLPPSGTVTFVFTDIEGNTQRWDRDGRNTARLIGNVELKLKEVGFDRDGTEKWAYEKLMAACGSG